MATIEIDTPNGPIPAVLELPGSASGGSPAPGVVVLHDGLGMSADTRRIARRFADNGYAAIAPDLYARGGMIRCIRSVMSSLTSRQGPSIDDILAARDHLVARDDVAGADRIGVIGFCLGGGFALAVAPRGFGASAPFYGTMPWKDLDGALAGTCPVVASYGKRDPMLRGAEAKLRPVLERHDVAHDVKTYDGAGHSFANEVDSAIGMAVTKVIGLGYEHDQAEDAFGRVFAFFGEHLSA